VATASGVVAVTATGAAESASGGASARESGAGHAARESAGGRAARVSAGARAVASAGDHEARATGGDLWATVTAEESASALGWGCCYTSQNCSQWLNRSASESAPLKLINNSHERSPRPRVRAQALQELSAIFA